MGCFLCWLTVHPTETRGCSVRLSVLLNARVGRAGTTPGPAYSFFYRRKPPLLGVPIITYPAVSQASQSFLPLRLRIRKEIPPKATTLETLEIV